MNRHVILCCVIGGAVFGAVQSFQVGWQAGCIQGLFFAGGMSAAMMLLPKIPWLLRQTEFPEELLLPGERVCNSWLANLVIDPNDYGLNHLSVGKHFWILGMKKKESIGGRLHLTNRRILFRAHRFNRVVGHTSVFLPTLRQIKDHSYGLVRQVRISTSYTSLDFVVTSPRELAETIGISTSPLTQTDAVRLRADVVAFPERCTGGMRPRTIAAQINRLVTFGSNAKYVVDTIANPISTIGGRLVEEFLEEPMTDVVDRKIRGKSAA